MIYFLSCEGETERWYFEWLRKQINNDPRTTNKVDIRFKKLNPSAFTKSNAGTFIKEMLRGSKFCRIQDIEGYDEEHMKRFQSLLKSTKEAKRRFRDISFTIGYSNFTFEVWILAHKSNVNEVENRCKYYQLINKAYNTSFINNDEYKHEHNFKKLLSQITLDDVIQNAIPECKRFVEKCYGDNPALSRELYGFKYICANPDTTLHIFVEEILKYAGLM